MGYIQVNDTDNVWGIAEGLGLGIEMSISTVIGIICRLTTDFQLIKKVENFMPTFSSSARYPDI